MEQRRRELGDDGIELHAQHPYLEQTNNGFDEQACSTPEP
jgi:hypothetical protein